MRSLLIAAVLALPAGAQTIYSWRDAQGLTHYTDDPAQVPKNVRVDATLLQERPLPAAATPTAAQAQVQPAAAAQQAQPTARDGKQYERDWRDRFIKANRTISTLEQGITALERARPQRVDCVAQPLIPVGTVQMGANPGAPITTAPGSQVITQNGYTTVVNGGQVYSPGARCAVNEEYDRITREIEMKQVELKDARADLEHLDRQASYDAVPREWRRGW